MLLIEMPDWPYNLCIVVCVIFRTARHYSPSCHIVLVSYLLKRTSKTFLFSMWNRRVYFGLIKPQLVDIEGAGDGDFYLLMYH